MNKMLPVIKTSEYVRLEKQVLDSEKLILEKIEQVGQLLAKHVIDYLADRRSSLVILLVGSGRNGADALACGRHLLSAGIRVMAWLIETDKIDALLAVQKEKFIDARGEMIPFEAIGDYQHAVLIDGMIGSGINRPLDPFWQKRIHAIQAWNIPILSIDAPTGLSGDRGVIGAAIQAAQTFYFDVPRYGFYFDSAPNHTGKLVRVAIDVVATDQVKPLALAWVLQDEALTLPKILRKRHKYQAGCVAAFCGNLGMEGAMQLAGLAALRIGAGIVKCLHYRYLFRTVFELIQVPFFKLKKVVRQAQAVMLGCGIGTGLCSKWMVKKIVKHAKGGLVIDADAIACLSLKQLKSLPQSTLITPHRQESLKLLGLDPEVSDFNLIQKIQEFVQETQLIYVQKGVPTFVLRSGELPIIIDSLEPGMATAGSGDVLTGMITGLLAQKMAPLEAALLGCALHQRAGMSAAKKKTSYALIASDLIENIPDAILSLKQDQEARESLDDTSCKTV